MSILDRWGEEKYYAPFRESLPPMLLLTTIFFLNFVSRVIFAPLLPQIEHDLGLSHAESGSFFLFISSGYFLSILFSGAVTARLGNKNTIVLSAISCGTMLFFVSQCVSLSTIRGGLFLLGYGAGLYLQAGLATIIELVAPSHLARGMAVHELAPNLGFVVAPVLSSFMLECTGWRGGLQLFGGVIIVSACWYGFKGKGVGNIGAAMSMGVVKRIVRLPEFWYMVLLFSFAICSTLGIYAMLPLYLVTEHSMEVKTANNLVAISRISSVFMPLAGGWLGDRFGNGRVMVTVLVCTGFLTLPLGLLTGPFLLAFVVLQPIVAVTFFPSGFAVLSRLGGKEMKGAGVSLCIPLAFLIGAGVIPALIGVAGDHLSLALGFNVAACFMIVVAALVAMNKTIRLS